MPARVPTEGASADLGQMIPAGHRDFVEQTLTRLGVPPLPDGSLAATACSAGCTRWPASTWRWPWLTRPG